MSFYAEIDAKLKEALKTKDRITLDTLRGLRAAIKNKEVELQRKLTEAEFYQLVAKQIRQREDAIAQFKKGNRLDLAEKEEKELEILKQFMPPPLSDDELEQLVRQVIAEVGAKGPQDMGRVMKEIMPRVSGRADGKRVSALVKQILSEGC
jgi:uncharacterized protein YqeY